MLNSSPMTNRPHQSLENKPSAPAAGPFLLELTGIHKSFLLPHERRDTLKENVLHLFKKRTYEHFKALQDINLTLASGDFVGIVGRNGSGKSTLLKIIAGIYEPDEGKIAVTGRMAPFLELGIGFQPELTARENIVLNATLLGLPPKTIAARFKQIVDFAEVENFLDLKIKNFSSGMQARLAFAIAIQTDADLYLCDEVLAVGDQGFQAKCRAVFKEWRQQGKSAILVSHAPALIAEFCNRVILLEQGKIVSVGQPAAVLAEYAQKF